MSASEDIVLTPDPRLSEMCAPIEKIDDSVRKLAKYMLDVMYDADGKLVRLVVIDVDYVPDDPSSRNPYVLINPKIVTADGDPRLFSEGCLSFPGISVDIERPSHVVVHATDLDGDLLQYEAENNLLAVCLQHEIDHLNGVTMVDHLPLLKRAKALHDCELAISGGARPGETSAE